MLRAVTLLAALTMAWPARAVEIHTTGRPETAVRSASRAICLAGGGSDDQWAEGWKFLLERSGGGDVVIIRADDSLGGYEDWIFGDPDKHGFPKVDSVTTILLTGAADAGRDDVEKLVLGAELVFFAGGDQSLYIDWLKGSKLAAAVERVMNVKKIPVAGTSAGMALLAGIDYSARRGSPKEKGSNVDSEDVLGDPAGAFVDLDRSVLTAPFMSQAITDTHFSERSRQGRLLGFMARAVHNRYPGIGWRAVKGVAADEGTAVCYDASGTARVYGAGSAFFLRGNAPIERLEAGKSLNWNASHKAVMAYVIRGAAGAAASFDLKNWTGRGGEVHYWHADGSGPGAPVFGID